MINEHQKHLFNIPDEVTYLNIAAQSPSPISVSEAGIEGIQQKSRPHEIMGSDYFDPVNQLRKLFAKVIDCHEFERVATCPSVSYGLANIANNIKLNAGDEILVIEEQFPSNIYVWQKLAHNHNAHVRMVKAPDAGPDQGVEWNAEILDAINEKTAVVAMGQIHWSNGIRFDLEAIREKTKAVGALLIVDGSQSIGAVPFSVSDINPDAVVCAGYKWLFGPYGCAYAYYGPHFDGGTPIEENWSNRLNSEDFAGLTSYQSRYKPLANRYMVGESGNFIYVKMQIAALKQVLRWSPQYIQDYCRDISSEAVNELKTLGCAIADPEQRTHHLFGIGLPEGLEREIIKNALQEHQIHVSFRGSYIRVSSHYFNTKEDFTALVKCMVSVLQTS